MGYSARQLFDIAADVDSYRKFLPLVKVSRTYDVQLGENGRKTFKGELLIQYMRLHIKERFLSNVTADWSSNLTSSKDRLNISSAVGPSSTGRMGAAMSSSMWTIS
jgi:coenzyme Q-binding protein COQ10